MQIVPPRYLVRQGRHVIVDALTPAMQSWCAETLAEPVPEELAAILRRLDNDGEGVQKLECFVNSASGCWRF